MIFKIQIFHWLGAAALAATGMSAFSQVPTDDVKVGTRLDASGIKLAGYTKPLPLPEGNWEVVGRHDYKIELTGNNGPSAAPMVSLALRNTDPSKSLVAFLVTYSPETIWIRWNGNPKCGNAKAAFSEDFGTTTGTVNYACSMAYFKTNSLKKYVLDSPDNKSEWTKSRFAPLIPYAAEMPDAHTWTHMGMSRDRGRNLAFTFLAKSSPTHVAGDKAELDLQAWVKTTGAAYMQFLDNTESTVSAFPAVELSAQN